MFFSHHQPPHKLKADMTTLKPLYKELLTGNCKLKTISDTAVASVGHSAALMPFQRQSAKFSPDKNVISAASPALSARQFRGITAINAAIAVTTATFTTF